VKPSTYQPISEEKLTSTGTSDTKTATVPNNTSGIYITVETNPARFTFSAAGDPQVKGLIIQKDQNPWFLPLGAGATLKFVSTVAGNSVAQLAYI